ncbi:MAG: hypothetical protein IJW06_01130 [Clostridia bacterium]|nr:hypothetical protein [Clostridia bacterium]
MKKTLLSLLCLPVMLFLLSGCSTIGSKTASMSVIYGATSVLSLLLLIGYCCFIKKKEVWFLLLFSSVFVVNVGYLTLSVSLTLEEALLANRISYLGSVFLPFSMIMTLFNLSGLKYKKWVPFILLTVTIAVFFVAASPGYLDIYYKSVSLESVNGMSVLKKEYGPWHCVYLYYLLLYFAIMIWTALYAAIKRSKSANQSAIIIVAVFVNICVWLIEQLVEVNFEFLSVSYIISELFLICVYLMIQDNEKQRGDVVTASVMQEQKTPESNNWDMSAEYIEKCESFEKSIETLTATEHAIYLYYVAGKTTKEILAELNIRENTLKFHNKNLYGKLGVTSRKQLVEYAKNLDKIRNK